MVFAGQTLRGPLASLPFEKMEVPLEVEEPKCSRFRWAGPGSDSSSVPLPLSTSLVLMILYLLL